MNKKTNHVFTLKTKYLIGEPVKFYKGYFEVSGFSPKATKEVKRLGEEALKEIQKQYKHLVKWDFFDAKADPTGFFQIELAFSLTENLPLREFNGFISRLMGIELRHSELEHLQQNWDGELIDIFRYTFIFTGYVNWFEG